MISKISEKKMIIIGFIIIFVFCFFLFLPKEESVEIEPMESLLVEEKQEVITSIQIDVKGAVKNPGVYLLEENKRVKDVIEKAGGLLESADASTINLSKKVTDEMVIIIYTKEEIEKFKKGDTNIIKIEDTCECPKIENDACIQNPVTNYEEETTSNGLVSINSASMKELTTLPGIGESKAKAIIAYREEHGGFKSIEEITNVSGIGKSTFEKIKEYITE